MKNVSILLWFARILAAVIMLQTLFYKFSGADESIYIFTKMGVEPLGRYGSGIVELIASILLLIPTYTRIGAFIGAFVMIGAIIFHILILGIEIMGDGGYLFFLACVTFVSCLVVLFFSPTTKFYLLKGII
jgi:uncharacterized membrane protein YphA (DoxX/SURF4 family)